MSAIEMLIDVHVEWQATLFGECEQKIEEGEGLIGVLRNAAYDIDAGCYRRLKPFAAGAELPRRIACQMRHHLQGRAVAAVLAQFDQSFNAANIALGFDVGVGADRYRSVSDALVDRAFGTCGNLSRFSSRGECTVAR